MTLDEIRAFVNRYHWTFSKTYAKFAPHEYYVKQNLDEEGQELFVKFVLYIREVGFPCKFGKETHIYFELDGKYYWTMGDPIEETIILNRCNVSEYYISGDSMYYRRPNHDISAK